MKRMKKIKTIEELKKIIEEKELERKQEKRKVIVVSSGTCGQARGSLKVIEAFKRAIRTEGLKDNVLLRITGCHGFCEAEPNVIIYPDGIFYQKLTPVDAKTIVKETILGGKIIEKLLYKDPQTKQRAVKEQDIPFYKKQMRNVLGDNVQVDLPALKIIWLSGVFAPFCGRWLSSNLKILFKQLKNLGFGAGAELVSQLALNGKQPDVLLGK
ncbi:MAG: (2Fe-2S) ferredoxin domain-containing protein [Candidatus Saccharicenans sp.]